MVALSSVYDWGSWTIATSTRTTSGETIIYPNSSGIYSQQVINNSYIPRGVWRRHSTRQIEFIKDMSDSHLLAAIQMVERGYDYSGTKIDEVYKDKLQELKDEAQKRSILERDDGWDN